MIGIGSVSVLSCRVQFCQTMFHKCIKNDSKEISIKKIFSNIDAEKKQTAGLEAQVASLTSQVAQKDEHLVSLKSTNQDLEEKANHNSIAITTLEAKIEQMSQSLELSNQEKEKLSEALNTEKSVNRDHIAAANQKEDKFNLEISQLSSQLESQRNITTELETKLEEKQKILEEKTQSASDEISMLKSKLQKLEESDENNQSELEKVRIELSQKSQNLSELSSNSNDEIKQKVEQLSIANKKLVQLQSDLEQANLRQTSVENILEERDSEIENLKELKQKSDAHEIEASTIIHNLTEKLHNFEKEFGELKGQRESDIKDLKSQNQALLEEIAQKTEKYGANVADLNQQLAELAEGKDKKYLFFKAGL